MALDTILRNIDTLQCDELKVVCNNLVALIRQRAPNLCDEVATVLTTYAATPSPKHGQQEFDYQNQEQIVPDKHNDEQVEANEIDNNDKNGVEAVTRIIGKLQQQKARLERFYSTDTVARLIERATNSCFMSCGSSPVASNLDVSHMYVDLGLSRLQQIVSLLHAADLSGQSKDILRSIASMELHIAVMQFNTCHHLSPESEEGFLQLFDPDLFHTIRYALHLGKRLHAMPSWNVRLLAGHNSSAVRRLKISDAKTLALMIKQSPDFDFLLGRLAPADEIIKELRQTAENKKRPAASILGCINKRLKHCTNTQSALSGSNDPTVSPSISGSLSDHRKGTVSLQQTIFASTDSNLDLYKDGLDGLEHSSASDPNLYNNIGQRVFASTNEDLDLYNRGLPSLEHSADSDLDFYNDGERTVFANTDGNLDIYNGLEHIAFATDNGDMKFQNKGFTGLVSAGFGSSDNNLGFYGDAEQMIFASTDSNLDLYNDGLEHITIANADCDVDSQMQATIPVILDHDPDLYVSAGLPSRVEPPKTASATDNNSRVVDLEQQSYSMPVTVLSSTFAQIQQMAY